MAMWLNHIGLEAEKEYTIYWNGVAYQCVGTAITEDGLTVICAGNIDLVMGGAGTGEPFVIMDMPAGIYDENPVIIAMIIDGSTEVSLKVEADTTVIHKLDKKYLDIATPNWNAESGTGGYIENRTHYSVDVGTIVFDATKTAGLDKFSYYTGLYLYRVSEIVFDADTMKAFEIYYSDSPTGTKTKQEGNSVVSQDNTGFIMRYGDNVAVYCIYDTDAASVSFNINVPSTGLYVACVPPAAYAELVLNKTYVKKIDTKYIDTVEVSNMVKGIYEKFGTYTIAAGTAQSYQNQYVIDLSSKNYRNLKIQFSCGTISSGTRNIIFNLYPEGYGLTGMVIKDALQTTAKTSRVWVEDKHGEYNIEYIAPVNTTAGASFSEVYRLRPFEEKAYSSTNKIKSIGLYISGETTFPAQITVSVWGCE